MDIQLIIYNHKYIYDQLLVSIEAVNYPKNNNENVEKIIVMPINRKGINSYAVSAYVVMLKNLNYYRQCAVKYLEKFLSFKKRKKPEKSVQKYIVGIKLAMPEKEFLDYKWGQRITQLTMEKKEIDYAMFWLSTLGGAFSAMGDQFDHCAEVAGKISVHQFKLAVRLGNPLLVARCQLYALLSLIQQKKFKAPRRIIPIIYQFAIKSNDKQLQRMCQGIWSKFKYSYAISKKKLLK